MHYDVVRVNCELVRLQAVETWSFTVSTVFIQSTQLLFRTCCSSVLSHHSSLFFFSVGLFGYFNIFVMQMRKWQQFQNK